MKFSLLVATKEWVSSDNDSKKQHPCFFEKATPLLLRESNTHASSKAWQTPQQSTYKMLINLKLTNAVCQHSEKHGLRFFELTCALFNKATTVTSNPYQFSNVILTDVQRTGNMLNTIPQCLIICEHITATNVHPRKKTRELPPYPGA
jgi:hypothetical protein